MLSMKKRMHIYDVWSGGRSHVSSPRSSLTATEDITDMSCAA